MKYRHQAFQKDGKWYVLVEDENLNVGPKEVPEDEVFEATVEGCDPRTGRVFIEDLGPCWEGEI